MSQDKAGLPAPGPAGIKAFAAEFYGLALDDASAARLAGELALLEAGLRAAGPAPIDAAPGALFRRLLLAGNPAAGQRRA